MRTVHETRREHLEELIAKYGKLADFNEAMGYPRPSSKFSRLRNANVRHDRPGKTYTMGDAVAREIEDTLGLPRGYMDTPPDHMTTSGNQQISQALKIMESMTPYQLTQAVRVLDSLAQPDDPAEDNGTRRQ